MDTLTNLIAGRPSMGKNPLPDNAGTAEWMGQLHRALREIETREQAPELVARAQYVLYAVPQLLRRRHTDSPALLQLLQIVENRGPAVDVVLRQPLGAS
ncbi:hypothetical protein [Streptomyces sp. A1136]|uniref:hypothetical protein n=1 Tax=Streptomyces sp. A1136 TaxID=2563102 RepID=UPI00109E3A47|nr:hypothetical protein [Streptomyces sp. A1136]THA53239.1 hypothetical protein E6R62_19310 [Streptomyces sp. A1136]